MYPHATRNDYRVDPAPIREAPLPSPQEESEHEERRNGQSIAAPLIRGLSLAHRCKELNQGVRENKLRNAIESNKPRVVRHAGDIGALSGMLNGTLAYGLTVYESGTEKQREAALEKCLVLLQSIQASVAYLNDPH